MGQCRNSIAFHCTLYQEIEVTSLFRNGIESTLQVVNKYRIIGLYMHVPKVISTVFKS